MEKYELRGFQLSLLALLFAPRGPALRADAVDETDHGADIVLVNLPKAARMIAAGD